MGIRASDGAPPWARASGGCLLVAFVAQAAIAALRDSVTIDEFVHLPVGLYMLRHADFSPDPINPPLSRMLPALPLAIGGLEFEPRAGVGHWGMGYVFMVENTDRYHALFVTARSATILIATALAALVYGWARTLYGWPSALVAAALFAFSPSMLAHGHLVTVDVPGALGITVTTYVAWTFLAHPTVGRAAAVGAVFGVSLLLKLSALLMAPLIVFFLVLGSARAAAGPRAARALLLLAIASGTTLVLLNAFYGFAGTLHPIGALELQPHGRLSELARSFAWLRLPLPATFVRGIDLALAGEPPGPGEYYFAGELSQAGWWYYHLAAFAMKTPLPLLGCGFVALGAWLGGRTRGRDDLALYLTIVAVFVVNTALNPLNIGVRHVIAAEPLLFIVVSPFLAGPIAAVVSGVRGLRIVGAAVLSAASLAWFAAASVAVAPRYLEYFNEAAGGQREGHRWLIDSNLDWGQDLIRLREYMDRRGLDSVRLAYFGRVHPGVYGIRFRPVERDRSSGTTVISASLLMGRPFFLWRKPDQPGWSEAGEFTWLQSHRPTSRVGSMFVYDFTGSERRSRP